MRRSIRTIASVCASAILAALVSPSPAAAQEKTKEETKQADRTVQLSERNESGVKGTVEIFEAARSAESEMAKHLIDLDLESLEAGATYRVHLHGGTCAEGGQVVTPVASVEADAEGRGKATAELPAEKLSRRTAAREAKTGSEEEQRHPALFLQARRLLRF